MDMIKLFKEASDAVDSINELLAKSSPLRKEAGEEPEMPEAPAQDPAAEIPDQAGDEAQDSDQDMGSEEEMSLAQHAESMSDEELHEFVEVLMQELEKRHGAQDQAPAEEGAPAPESAPGAQPEMEKSSKTKDDYSKMHKSIDQIAQTLAKVAERMDKFEDKLVKSAPATKAKPSVPAVKVPAMNAGDEVLTKSAPKVQRLSKSETAEFLLGRMRNGDRQVSSDDLAALNSIKSEDQLYNFQDHMSKKGIQFPKI